MSRFHLLLTFVALAVLMPIVASMGGIAGSQTLTIAIRGIALGQISRKNARKLMMKEVAVGIFNGMLWAAVVAAVARKKNLRVLPSTAVAANQLGLTTQVPAKLV